MDSVGKRSKFERQVSTLIKKKRKFSSSGNSEGAGAKSYMTNGILKYWEKFAHFLIY
jgi:hypothetical protein